MEVIQELLLPCLWGMVACVGFGLVFNIQGGGILICGLGGALGWFVYLIAQRLLGGDILPAFLVQNCYCGMFTGLSGCGVYCHLLGTDGPGAPLSGNRVSPGGAFAAGTRSGHL